jgi:hypothetical protein
MLPDGMLGVLPIAAQPLDKVLPSDVLRQVALIAALHFGGNGSQAIQ